MPNRFPVVLRTRPFKIVGFEDNLGKFQTLISDFNKCVINYCILEIWNLNLKFSLKEKERAEKKYPLSISVKKMGCRASQ